MFDLTGVAEEFLISEKFKQRFGTEETLDDASYLALLYQNVLGRKPDAEGLAFWSGRQKDGLGRADMLQHISESSENFEDVMAKINTGIFYI